MKLSLYKKLALTLFVTFVVIAAIFVWWTQALSQVSKSQAEQQLHLALATHLVDDNPLIKKGVYDYDGLSNLFHTLMILGPSFEFYFVSPEGKLLTYSATPGEVKRQYIDITPLQRLLKSNSQLPVFGDDPRSVNGSKIFSVAPVFNQDILQGYLYIIIGSSKYDSIIEQLKNSDKVMLGVSWLLGTLFFLLIVVLLLLNKITKPVSRLTQYIDQVSQNQFNISQDAQINWPEEHDEIHQLGRSVNAMLDKIQQQLATLNLKDEQRRELLSQLSHDLRTPLASLKGYIELIEKQTSDKNIVPHIEIASKNINQLNHLIAQIFELAHLEAGHTKLHVEPFNLLELMYDVAAKFKLRAEANQLQIVVSPPQSTLVIVSDIGKLDRVLSNLIDNAIRHTEAGGEISLVLEECEGYAYIKVNDTGIGISASDLQHIFDASFQAKNSNSNRKHNAGLGLAITSELIKILKGRISVASALNEGCQFTIVLPLKE
ncbi:MULTISPECIES: HAMP domain-containing sensor histidine kinase [unclassified Pseudoalteromonas]|uniref:HAMP domain-containing sensor histidine kinase n=1 Tax=unclassified Pseudoalteromonas TaxID=194690 RepID=UPI000FFF1864|nr:MULTISPECIES: HAMP domain-containing sensor histidine kinase [unclassified Pseudoalteromonas]MCG9760911.1 HAMP domain-containing histidine kinase [Pseudoalteromonas sp. Isolate6]RXE85528.1 sensor histidine kinase [Pseudoalteromonas sp. A757]